MKNKSDTQLVLEAKNGNESALEEIYHRYEKSLFYTAYKITGNKDDAQDALQDTFLQISRSICDIQRPEFLKLWMNRIIAGKCRDIFRRNKTVTVDMDTPQFYNQYVEERIDHLPEKELRFQTDKELIDYYIMQLPYLQREAIIMMYFQNFSLQQIADLSNEPLGTIKSRIHLAKKSLRQHLAAYEKREDVNVNFQSLDALLVSTFAVGFEKTIMKMQTISITKTKWTKQITSFLCTSVGKIIIVTSVCAVFGIVSISRFYDINHNVSNQSLIFKGKIVQTDHDAYFLFMNWAMNEDQLRLKTENEILEYQELYEYLKAHQGAYFESLENSGISTVFESLI